MATPISFPAALPGPSVASITPAERRLLSDLPGPLNARGIQRDYLAVQQLEWNLLDPAAAAILKNFDDVTLTFSAAWFASTWPLPAGWVAGVRRFIGRPRWQHVAGGFWRVTATCEVRGRSLLPYTSRLPVIWDDASSQLSYTYGSITQAGWVINSANQRAASIAASFNNFPPNTPAGGTHLMLNAKNGLRSSGKLYFEIYISDTSSSDSTHVIGKMGIAQVGFPSGGWWPAYTVGVSSSASGADGSDYVASPTPEAAAYQPGWPSGGVMMFAVDLDLGRMWVGKNGAWQNTGGNDPATNYQPTFIGVVGPVMPFVRYFAVLMVTTLELRTRLSDMTYAPPTGFLAWE